MRIFVRLVLSAAWALLAFRVVADPATPINIHGQLLSSAGEPVFGSRAYTLSFFDAASGGNLLGTAITGNVDVSTDGLFNLSVEPPSDFYEAAEVWYSLGVDTDEPADGDASDDIFPSRIRVYYVPLAVQAIRALSVDAVGVGIGTVDNTELDMLNGVTSNVQEQIDAIDTTAIAQHTTDIATNTDNIALKANSADVYTQSAADAKFVALAGATMSGALGVNTINEATAASGVTVDGVKLQDNFVELASIVPPGDPGGKLYRSGADLFWNGTQINGGGGDTDTIQWSGFYLYDLDEPVTALRYRTPKSGRIVDFQVSCSDEEADEWTVDFRVNGASILASAPDPAPFVGNSIQYPELSNPYFNESDMFELVLDNAAGEIHGVSISIIVEY